MRCPESVGDEDSSDTSYTWRTIGCNHDSLTTVTTRGQNLLSPQAKA
jgi:hypothetical protein